MFLKLLCGLNVSRPAPTANIHPDERKRTRVYHPLPIHTTISSTVTAALPHLIVLRILGCGFMVR